MKIKISRCWWGGIGASFRKDEQPSIGVLSRSSSTHRRPSASYKASETIVERYGRSHRALVIHSSAHDKRGQKRIDRENVRTLKKPFKPVQLYYLKALGLTEDIFTSSQPPTFPKKSTG